MDFAFSDEQKLLRDNIVQFARRELNEDAYVLRGSSGFGFREGTLGRTKVNLFGGGSDKAKREPRMDIPT